MAKGRRSQVVPLLILLAILGGAGGWNYKRNVEAENAEPRPFRGYADADLEALLDAYRTETAAYQKRYEAATGRKPPVRGGQGLAGQVAQFEQIQRASRDERRLAAAIAERQVSIQQLEEEQGKREDERDFWKVLLRRVFVVRA